MLYSSLTMFFIICSFLYHSISYHRLGKNAHHSIFLFSPRPLVLLEVAPSDYQLVPGVSYLLLDLFRFCLEYNSCHLSSLQKLEMREGRVSVLR